MDIKDLEVNEIRIYAPQDKTESAITFHWNANIGWGELSLYYDNGKWKANTECMCSNDDKQFIIDVLKAFVDTIEVVG